MKATQYEAITFKKKGDIWTKFIIGSKVIHPMLENTIITLGGIMVKQTKMAKHYEVKGDQMKLMVI